MTLSQSGQPQNHSIPARARQRPMIDKTMMKALFPDGTMQLERYALFTKSVMMSRPYTNK